LDLTFLRLRNILSQKSGIIFLALAIIGFSIIIFFVIKSCQNDNNKTSGAESGMPAIRIVISNGCGYEGLANTYKEYCSKLNVEVVRLDNTAKPLWDRSVIIIRQGDRKDLLRLQEMTGIQLWTEAKTSDYDADFEIILGRDYDNFIR